MLSYQEISDQVLAWTDINRYHGTWDDMADAVLFDYFDAAGFGQVIRFDKRLVAAVADAIKAAV